MYSLILGKIKINDPITLSKYPTKYEYLFFVSISFETTVQSASTTWSFIDFFAPKRSYFDPFA